MQILTPPVNVNLSLSELDIMGTEISMDNSVYDFDQPNETVVGKFRKKLKILIVNDEIF